MSLAAALERAAGVLEKESDEIRSANGDPGRLRRALGPEVGASVLAWLLTNETEAGAELAEAWAEDEAGVPYVLAVREDALPKAGRKELRRVLHRLRGRGVALPKAPPAPVTAMLPKVDDAVEAALVSALDPTGARLAYLVEPNPSGGVRIFEVIFDAFRGILECSVYTSGRSGARKLLRELEGRPGAPAVSVAPAALRVLLARAAQAHPSDRPMPRGFSEWRSHLTTVTEGARAPGDEAVAALTGGEGSLSRAIEMVRAHEIGPWPPPEAPLRAAIESLQELSKARIVVTGAQKEQQIDATLRGLLEDDLDPAGATRAASRFTETAYVFWKQGREEDARACLAAARSFGDTPAGENTVARALLEVVLAPMLERLREEEDSSLIVKP